ncbi:amidohydrolase [Terasakiispira papahanaumokuakeensis]|uniref:Amidohydrolase n=1 Tax=Terasakiispira papahanaumokuakeensis TaxID=197479 RepID=A0A1E2V7B4_9GAMM|nr:amidohydrolase family protein [Terasakiispira papahanaumokuakeensis]ODC02742.1 amidohydrolase [Terasakiispira papahanaumokuakeensis]
MSIPENTRPLTGPAPRLKAPAGATDCHVHVFLPGFEAQPGGPQIAELATVENYRALQQWLGLDRVVLTQPNAYQTDNRALLTALDQLGPDVARAIAVVTPETTQAELKQWHDQGVRGARIMQLPGGAVGIDRMLAVEQVIREMDWHLMVQFNGRDLSQYLDELHKIEGRYIIDHIGKFMDPVPADDVRVDEILRLLDKGNAWFKVCGAYETSLTGGPDFADVAPLAKRVIEHAPERILWGSNWPHVGVQRSQYPSDVEQLDVLLDWADEPTRQKILVDNPAALYGF